MINGTLRIPSTQNGFLSAMDLLVAHAPGQRTLVTLRQDSFSMMPFCADGGHFDLGSIADIAEFYGARFLTAHSSLV
ncbi:MAG: hypothetical protein HY268_32425 [Deltaproteobacteria bacterium]|nr:hypothetical protein [Deltaproteobacteria bacterium]